MSKAPKKKKFDVGAMVRSNARDRIGPVPPTKVVPNKKLKKQKRRIRKNEASAYLG